MTDKKVDLNESQNSTQQTAPLIEKEQAEDKTATIPNTEAFCNVWRNSRWMMLNVLLHPIYSIVNAIVLGHQDNEKMLAGLGLGSLTMGICALSIGTCFNGAVGTFISHAYGQKEYRQCQVFRNKAIYLSTILYVVLAIPLICIRPIYAAMGQDDEMADYATSYVHYTLPFIYFFYMSQIYSTFACNQEVTWYGFYATLTGTCSHAIMICIFYFWLDLGYKGVILATGIMFILRASVNIGMVTFRNDVRKHDDVYLFSRETTNNVWPLARKSFASMMLGIWGWWSFDIFTLMATYIGATEAGAQTIMRSIGLLTFMMPVGFSIGCRILIGKSIGQEKTNLAFQYYRVSQLAAVGISVFQISLLLILKDQIIGLFTSEPFVAECIASAWPVLCIFTLFDATQTVSGSFIGGTGKQCLGAIFTSSGYWVFGIPLAYYFALYKDMGIPGLWIGPVFACAYLTLMYNILILCINWNSLYDEIRERRETENREATRLLQEALAASQAQSGDYQKVQDTKDVDAEKANAIQ